MSYVLPPNVFKSYCVAEVKHLSTCG